VGLAGAGLASGLAVGAARFSQGEDGHRRIDDPVPFFGRHQAGIVTPAQDRMMFASFDVVTEEVGELRSLLGAWTAAAAQMTQGLDVGESGAVDGPNLAPPDVTGEALGLPASALTVTFGFGPSLFVDADGRDRLGLGGRRPEALIDLPHFPADALDPARSGGDLCVQACANDPQVAFHAVRNLARIGFGVVSLRWSQLGFGRTSSTTEAQETPRNLFGFKDGTANIKAEESAELDRHVWVQRGDGPQWMTGGSYLVARRISMRMETWDRAPLAEQEAIVGRTKGAGAPLSGGDEMTEPDFAMKGARDEPIIPVGAHVRLAHPEANDGVRILRRGYNMTDGSDGLGRLDGGLFFIAFVRDPARQFVPMQERLARHDTMMEYLVHTGSALFAVPPGVPDESRSIADQLFAR
jgi:deferrochelatase/peroxidase EfeB